MAEDLVQFARGDVISRRYEIEDTLGAGMLGVTYKARHISSGKTMALKVLRPELVGDPRDRDRLTASFERAKAIKDEGVVRLGEVGEHQRGEHSVMYFTQEYFESQNLRQLLDEYQAEKKSFSLQEACQIANKILEAAAILHQHGIVHRNIKPENVLVHTRKTGPGGKNLVRTIKITDHGMADLLGPTIFASSYISRSEARYLAPELSGFDQKGSPPSDVYSVGVILYELLVGQPPRGTYLSPTQLRGDLPEHIDDIVELALAANSEDRYPTPSDMRNDIQRSFSELSVPDKGPTSFRAVLIAVGIAVAAVGLVGVYLATRDAPDPLADAKAKDEIVRKQAQANSRIPSEAELQAMVARHQEMLYVPPGPFVVGRLNAEDLQTASQSEPLAKVVKVDGFYIDRFEFPNRKTDGDGNPAKPVAKVTWEQAAKACEDLGKRLCEANEWEKACKGPANWIYSYGDTYDVTMCGAGVGDPYTLGENETCISGYGVWGMSGGLREWTATVEGSKGNRRQVKGGLRGNNERGSRCAFAVDENQGFKDGTLTFRCCLDVESEAAPATPEGTAVDVPAEAG